MVDSGGGCADNVLGVTLAALGHSVLQECWGYTGRTRLMTYNTTTMTRKSKNAQTKTENHANAGRRVAARGARKNKEVEKATVQALLEEMGKNDALREQLAESKEQMVVIKAKNPFKQEPTSIVHPNKFAALETLEDKDEEKVMVTDKPQVEKKPQDPKFQKLDKMLLEKFDKIQAHTARRAKAVEFDRDVDIKEHFDEQDMSLEDQKLEASSALADATWGMSEKRVARRWTKLAGLLKHHIALSGLDATSKRLALQRLPLWLNSCQENAPDSLSEGMDVLNQFFDETAIVALRHTPGGGSVLRWFLDCLAYIPRLLWRCCKQVIYNVFGQWLPKLGVYTISEEPCITLVDWCSDFWSDKLKYLGNALAMPKWLPKHACCQETRFLVGITAAPDSVWCSRLCIHNESRALVNRQLLDPISTPEVRKAFWDINLREFNKEFPCPETGGDFSEEELLEKFLEKYPLRRRDTIRRAFKLTKEGHYYASSYTNAFVKREWNVYKALAKRDPRVISAKTEEYLASSAPDYYQMMKEICKLHWGDVDSILNDRKKFIYTGGLTPDQIGAIVSHYEKLGYHFYEGDYSRYDAHNEEEALDAEFNWYNLNDELKTVLRLQLQTRGGTRSGIRFSHRGKVASGVINTSFGNTIRGFMMIAGWCAMNGIEDYVVMQLGDDNVLMFKEPIDLESLCEWTTNCGHKLEIVHRPDVDLLEFCSMRFWDTGDTRVLGPKIGRILGKTFISTDPNLKYDQLGSYVQQVALGMKYYTWIPVLGNFLWKLMEKNLQGTEGRTYSMPKKNFEHKLNLRVEVTVDREAVVRQFYKIYGFDPVWLEESLREWTPTLGTAINQPLLTSICVTDGVADPVA